MPEAVSSILDDLVSAGQLEIGDGYRTKQSEHGRPGLPILRVAEVLDGRIEPKFEDFVSDAFRQAMGQKISRPGDIVLTTKGTVGRVVMMPADGPEFVYSPQVCYFRAKPTGPLLGQYLYYWFKSEQFWSQARSLKGQTDMADYINLADIRSLRIELPRKQRQQAIADVLGALDDKIAVNDRIAAASHKLAGLFYEDASKGHAEAPLSAVVEPILGGTPDRTEPEYWGPGNPWVSAKDVAGSRFGVITTTEEEITDLAVAQTKAKPVHRGSVILTARGTVGTVARVAQPTSFNQSCYAFEPKLLPPATLYLTVLAAARKMLSVAHGTVFSTVTMKTLDHLYVASLNPKEIGTLENRAAPLLELIESCVRESQALARLRDTLLPGLMSGEIRVKDAEKAVEEAT
jgi:type I restriction enzyme S subunit